MCVAGEEYEVSPLSAPRSYVGQDRVCSSYKSCDPVSEYLEMLGNATHDNVCSPRTDCSLIVLGGPERYELKPSVDAKVAGSNGSDSVCAEYTRCSPGHYANFTGTKKLDRQCSPCGQVVYDNSLKIILLSL